MPIFALDMYVYIHMSYETTPEYKVSKAHYDISIFIVMLVRLNCPVEILITVLEYWYDVGDLRINILQTVYLNEIV